MFLTLNISKDTTSSVHLNVCRSRRSITPLCLTLSLLFHLQQLNYQPKLKSSMTFKDRQLKFHDFPGLENEILKFHDFPGFPWPVRTLHNTVLPAHKATSFTTRLKIKTQLFHLMSNRLFFLLSRIRCEAGDRFVPTRLNLRNCGAGCLLIIRCLLRWIFLAVTSAGFYML